MVFRPAPALKQSFKAPPFLPFQPPTPKEEKQQTRAPPPPPNPNPEVRAPQRRGGALQVRGAGGRRGDGPQGAAARGAAAGGGELRGAGNPPRCPDEKNPQKAHGFLESPAKSARFPENHEKKAVSGEKPRKKGARFPESPPKKHAETAGGGGGGRIPGFRVWGLKGLRNGVRKFCVSFPTHPPQHSRARQFP